jgi:hypothetical protein
MAAAAQIIQPPREHSVAALISGLSRSIPASCISCGLLCGLQPSRVSSAARLHPLSPLYGLASAFSILMKSLDTRSPRIASVVRCRTESGAFMIRTVARVLIGTTVATLLLPASAAPAGANWTTIHADIGIPSCGVVSGSAVVEGQPGAGEPTSFSWRVVDVTTGAVLGEHNLPGPNGETSWSYRYVLQEDSGSHLVQIDSGEGTQAVESAYLGTNCANPHGWLSSMDCANFRRGERVLIGAVLKNHSSRTPMTYILRVKGRLGSKSIRKTVEDGDSSFLFLRFKPSLVGKRVRLSLRAPSERLTTQRSQLAFRRVRVLDCPTTDRVLWPRP